jgi:hypothetical protein
MIIFYFKHETSALNWQQKLFCDNALKNNEDLDYTSIEPNTPIAYSLDEIYTDP